MMWPFGGQAERHRQRFVCVQDQRRGGRPRGEGVAAEPPGLGVDPIAESPQMVDVTSRGAYGDTEAISQSPGADAGIRLEDCQRLESAAGGSRHDPNCSAKP